MNHFLKFSLLTIALGVFGFGIFVGEALADTHTWDGGGADNNWSTCANWDVADTCPVAGDTVTFNATSTKASTIDAGFGGTILTFNISAGYTNTITQSRSLIVNGVFTQSAGTFLGGADSLDFNAAFTLDSGATFISTSGTAYFADNFTIAEGAGSNAFQHNNGTVVCDASGTRTWQLDSTNTEADETFYNFQINAIANSYGVTGVNGEIFVITSTLTLTNGVFHTAGAILDARGAVSVASVYDGGTGTVSVSGSGTNAVTMVSGFISFNVFILNNTNATVDFTGSTSTTFTRAVTLQAGTFNQDSASLTFLTFTQSGGTFNGGSSGTMTFNGAFAQSGGTFNGGSQNLDFNSTFTLNVGATFISTSGTAYFSNFFTIAEGAGANAWQHNNGTVVYDGSIAYTWQMDSTNAEADEIFYNFQMNGSSNIDGVNGETLVVIGTLTLTNGSFNTAGAIMSAQGAVNVASTYDGGTGTLIISGSGTNAITIASGFTAFNVFTLNNANATVNFTGSSSTTFSRAITIQAGVFNQDSAPLIFGSTFTQSGGTFNTGSVTNSFSDAFAQSGGTFNGGSQTLDFNNTFTLNSGATFISTSGTAYFANTFTIAEGAGSNAWQHNNGTVVYDGAASYNWTVDSTNAEADETFNNFQIDSTSNLNLTTGEIIVIAGTSTLTNGVFNTGTMSAQGAVSVASTYDGGSGTLLISGSGINTITMASGFTAFNVFTLNNANATVNFTGSSTTTFSRVVTLQAGIFNGGSQNFTFSDAFTISGGTFNAPTGIMSVNSTWTHTAGGTFNHNNGTVKFIANSNPILDSNSSEAFYNFIVDCNGDSACGDAGYGIRIASGDNLIINSTAYLTDGTLAYETVDGGVTVKGDVQIGSGWDHGGTFSAFTFSDSAIQTITIASGAEAKFNANITINKTGGSVGLSGTALTMDQSGQDLLVQQGTLDLNGANLTVSGVGTETLIINNTGNLQLQGGETLTADSASYPQFDLGSTVTYDGVAGPYIMKDWTMTNATLVINGGASSMFTLGATETIKNVTITSGILSLDANGLTVSTTFSNDGTLRWRGSGTLSLPAMDTNSGTIEFTGDGDAGADTYTVTTLSSTYYNLIINSTDGATDIFQLGAALDVNNNFTITAGDFDVSADSRAITIGGNWANTGTFTKRSGTVTFDDSAKTSILSGSTTFNNFTCTTQDKNLQFTAASTQTISGTLTLTGAASHLIVLRSTSGGSYWNIIAGAGQAVTYVNVMDSDASGGTIINPGLNSFDAGHNLNWQFQPEVNWTSASQSGAESAGTLTLTAQLSYVYASDVTIPYTMTGTASSPSDYSITVSPLVITAGNPSGSITITITDDVIDELDETVIVTMGVLTNGIKGATDVHTATITDNDSAPTISINDPSVSEATDPGTFTVTLTGGSYLGVTVDFATSAGTATALGTDYTDNSGTLTWAADETGTKTFIVATVNDTLDENNETINAALTNPVNATISDASGVMTLVDNDDPPTIVWTFASQSSAENNPTMTVTAQLSTASGLNVTLPYTMTGTATGSGTDYSITASPVTITAGSTTTTVTITVVNDTLDENDETVIVTIGSPTNATVGVTTVHTATITDNDDAPTVAWTASTQSGAESVGTLTITAQLSTASGLNVTLPYTMTGTATGSGTDYSITASPVTITAGSTTTTVTITVVNDTLDENDETVIVTIGSPTNATVGATSVHTATITDNDDPPLVNWTTSTQSIEEATSTITITAELSGASSFTITVPFTVSGTAAGGGVDYTVGSSPLTISAGSTTADISLTVVEETVVEPTETVIVTMGTPTNGTKGTTDIHIASITNDDAPRNSSSSSSGTSAPSSTVSSGGTQTTTTTITDDCSGITAGSNIKLVWTATSSVNLVNLYYSTNEGDTYTKIAGPIANTESYSWTVPSSLADNSSIQFKIEGTDLVTITSSYETESMNVCAQESKDSGDEDEQDSNEQDTDDTDSSQQQDDNDTVDDIVVPIGMAIETVFEDKWLADAQRRNLDTSDFPTGEVAIGSLVKLPDDGNPNTQTDSAVYYIGSDHRRHPFPNESVYKTWFTGFFGINILDGDTMSNIPIGPMVTYRPGSTLVKFPSINNVYVIDVDGSLRWIASEDLAQALYGDEWNKFVLDVSEAFYFNYTFGNTLASMSDMTWDTVMVLYGRIN